MPRQRHSKHCSATYSAGQPRSSTVPALSPQQSKQRAPQPGTGRSMGLYLLRLPGTPSHATAAQRPRKTAPGTAGVPRSPRPSVGRREEPLYAQGNRDPLHSQLRRTVTSSYKQQWQQQWLTDTHELSLPSSPRSNTTCLFSACEPSPCRGSASWLLRNLIY